MTGSSSLVLEVTMKMMMTRAVTGFMTYRNQKVLVNQTLVEIMEFAEKKRKAKGSSSVTARSHSRGRNVKKLPNDAKEADVVVESV